MQPEKIEASSKNIFFPKEDNIFIWNIALAKMSLYFAILLAGPWGASMANYSNMGTYLGMIKFAFSNMNVFFTSGLRT